MKPVKLVAIPECKDEDQFACIHVNDLKGRTMAILWMDNKITFSNVKEYDAVELEYLLNLQKVFHALFNNLMALQEELKEKENEIEDLLTPTLAR